MVKTRPVQAVLLRSSCRETKGDQKLGRRPHRLGGAPDERDLSPLQYTVPQDPAASRQRKAALDILEETTLFFEAALRRDDGRDATHYLKQRGLDSAIVKTYRIGYSPRMGLRAAVKDKGFSDEDVIVAGVNRKSDRDGSLYDYFRNRVMFPIENRQSKVIAFGDRALGEAQPKYLNSGEVQTRHHLRN